MAVFVCLCPACPARFEEAKVKETKFPAAPAHPRKLFLFTLFGLLVLFCLTAAVGTAAQRRHATQRKLARTRHARQRQAHRDTEARRERIERARHFDESSVGEEEDENGDEVLRREQWFMFQRTYPFDSVPENARQQAWAARPHQKRASGEDLTLAATPTWHAIGPAPTSPKFTNWGLTSGRINAIAVKPDNPQVVLIGAASGGIWRSIDGGANFTPVSDSQVDLSVASICFSKSSPNVVYAAMGDLYNSYLGTGVLKSTDGGQTWTRVSNSSLPSPGLAVRIEVDPIDPNRVYLTQPAALLNQGVNSGIFRNNNGFFVSTDGGVNWIATFFGSTRDVVISPADHNTLYLAARIVDAQTNCTTGSCVSGVLRSSDGGLHWANVYTSPYGSSTGDLRLAVTPSSPHTIYGFLGNNASTPQLKVIVSHDDGTTWTDLSTTGIDPGQFGYNTYIQVDPTNANTVYVGTRDVYKSTNGGQTWTCVTKNFSQSGSTFNYSPSNSDSHPDQHSFSFASVNDPNTIYIGNDGGLWKTTDAFATTINIHSLNATLALTQFVGLVMDPTDATRTYGGAQDNGTQARVPGGTWQEFAEGDGGHPVVNAPDPSIVFSTYVFGAIRWWRFNPDGTRSEISSRRTSETTFGESTNNPRIAFYAPFTNNGVDSTVYFGTWRLFISQTYADSTQPLGWTAPGGTFDQTKGGTDVINAIGVAHTAYSNSQVIYTGSAQGRAMVSTNGGQTWTDITAGLPNRTITSIKVDPLVPSTAYLTVSGYGTGHVFKTINTGATWTDISGLVGLPTSLPNIPTSDLLLDPNVPGTIYVATDIGVFRSLTGGITWETFNTGLPPTVVTGFATNASGQIQIGTYGRGAYELTTASTATIQFGAPTYSFNEGVGDATIMVTRTGDTSSAVSVDYRTTDADTFTVGCADTVNNQGAAYARCDFATAVGTLSFAAGETTKTISVPIIDDTFVETAETFQVVLSNPVGASLGSPSTATVTIVDNDTPNKPNPMLAGDATGIKFFVRQQYLDFLSREPEQGEPWSNVLTNCQNQFNLDPTSASAGCDRILVSQSFFGSPEFQLKGFYVFRFYKVAFNRLPEYTEIIPDMSFVAGSTPAEVFARKAQLAVNFTQRQEFLTDYGAMSNQTYVNTLLARYGLASITTPDPQSPDGTTKVTLTNADLTNGLNAGTLTRAQVLRAIADSDQVGSVEFNNAFVAMQYYGYLRRKPEPTGYQAWLQVLQSGDIRTMVNGFLNSAEYRLRFGPTQ
jgi:photosystem II stability/assembly factor-like uncharacterized protein